MRPITREMIKTYKIKKLKYDFMGYNIHRMEDLSFHHLIVPKRECKDAGLGEGYLLWNGAILNQSTSHDYLHLIERIDREKFLQITYYMIQENKLGELDINLIKQIREVLLLFEQEQQGKTDKKGHLLIRKPYIEDRIPLKVSLK